MTVSVSSNVWILVVSNIVIILLYASVDTSYDPSGENFIISAVATKEVIS